MGTNTPKLNLYKPASIGEKVDVVAQINQNYDKLDTFATQIDDRVTGAEGAAGVGSWKVFTPVFRNSAAVAFTGGTGAYGRCQKLGDLVFVEVNLNGPISGPSLVQTEPSLFLDLPYAMKNARFSSFSGYADFASSFMLLKSLPDLASTTKVRLQATIETGTDNYIQSDRTTDVNWASVTGSFVITGWYRSTGASILSLTDE